MVSLSFGKSRISVSTLWGKGPNDPNTVVDINAALDEMLEIVGERNFDLYDGTDGTITKT